MSVGGKRPGAGHPLGATTIRSREIANRAIAEGISPLEVLLDNMRTAFAKAKELEAEGDLDAGMKLRLIAQEAAKDAAGFVHPRLAAITLPPEPRVVAHRSREEIIADLAASGFPEEVLAYLRSDPNRTYQPSHKLSKPPPGSNGSGSNGSGAH